MFSPKINGLFRQRHLQVILIIFLTFVGVTGMDTPLQPASAQPISLNIVWQIVYKRIPDLPKENKYISRETGEVSAANTLVSRLIRYHIFIKQRPPNFRLDWKLTLADYLGANEIMYHNSYPGHNRLRTNPLDGDIAAIKKLSRKQRNQLVQVLTDIFSSNPQSGNPN